MQFALDKLEHKLSADAHAARLSELRSKQRLLESLSQAPPAAGRLFAQQSSSGLFHERVTQPISLNEIMNGLRRVSTSGSRSPSPFPTSTPVRDLAPRALHFTGATPAPTGQFAASGPTAPTVQRPTQHTEPPKLSQALSPRASPDAPSARGRQPSPAPNASAGGRTRPALAQSGSASATSAIRPLSPQLQAWQQQQNKQQALQQQQAASIKLQQQPQPQKPLSVEQLNIRPHSTARRYMSPSSAASAAGSMGGGSSIRDSLWTSAGGRTSGGGGSARLNSRIRGGSSTNLDSILRGLASGTSGGAAASTTAITAATASAQSKQPFKRSSTTGGGAGNDGSFLGQYTSPMRSSGTAASSTSLADGGVLGSTNSSNRTIRPLSAGLQLLTHVPAASGRTSEGIAATALTGSRSVTGATTAATARPRSAPRSLSAQQPNSTTPTAGRGSAAGVFQSLGSRGLDFLSSQKPTNGPVGGASRATISPLLLSMPSSLSRGRSPIAEAPSLQLSPYGSGPRAAFSMEAQLPQRQQPPPQQPLSGSHGDITETLFHHAAAAQRLQTQLLNDAITDGASSPAHVPQTDPESYDSDDEGGPASVYEREGLSQPEAISPSPSQFLDAGLPANAAFDSSGVVGSSVKMVEALLRRGSSDARSDGGRAWTPPGRQKPPPQVQSMRSVSPSSLGVVVRSTPSSPPMTSMLLSRAAAPSATAASLQSVRAVSGPQEHVLQSFIMPSSPLWPSVGRVSDDGGRGRGTPSLFSQKQRQLVSPRLFSSEEQRPPHSGRSDDGGVGLVSGSPMRPQGLVAGSGDGGGDDVTSGDVSSPERSAQGLQALLSFLQQKFEQRRERRRAARALEGWRQAAVSSGVDRSSGDVALDGGVKPLTPEVMMEAESASSSRMRRYYSQSPTWGNDAMDSTVGGRGGGNGNGPEAEMEAQGQRAASPMSSTEARWMTSNTERTASSAAAAGTVGSPQYTSASWPSHEPATIPRGTFSPGLAFATTGPPPTSPQRIPKGWNFSVSGADVDSSSSSSPGPEVSQPPSPLSTRLPSKQHETAEQEAHPFSHPQHLQEKTQKQERREQTDRIYQLEQQLKQARQQQEDLLQDQPQELHHQQLQKLQQQLQQLQDQLAHHHRQQQDQMERLQLQHQQHIRHQQISAQPTSVEAKQQHGAIKKAVVEAPVSDPAAARGATLLPAVSKAAALPSSPKQSPALLTTVVPSPTSSKAAFRDLHHMVGEMERLLSAMNEDVAEATAAAAGTSTTRASPAKTTTIHGRAASADRTLAAVSSSHSHPQPQPRAHPSSPGFHTRGMAAPSTGPARGNGGNSGAAFQQGHTTTAAATGSRTVKAKSSLEASLASAAATAMGSRGGNSGHGSGSGSRSGSGGGTAGPAAIHGSAVAAGAAVGAALASRSVMAGMTTSAIGEVPSSAANDKGGVRASGKLGDFGDSQVRLRTADAAASPAAAALLLASAGRAHANAAAATDAMSDQLREMRSSIRRIEQEMWGAAAVTHSLARGVAAAAAAASAGSPAVQHRSLRPVPVVVSPTHRSVRPALDSDSGRRTISASQIDVPEDSTSSSRAGALYTTFSFRDAFLNNGTGASSAAGGTGGGSSAAYTPSAARTGSASGSSAAAARVAGKHASTLNGNGRSNPYGKASGALDRWVAATVPTTVFTRASAPSRNVAASTTSPGVTRHVDALEAQLLEELGELEGALFKLRTNTGRAIGRSGSGSASGSGSVVGTASVSVRLSR